MRQTRQSSTSWVKPLVQWLDSRICVVLWSSDPACPLTYFSKCENQDVHMVLNTPSISGCSLSASTATRSRYCSTSAVHISGRCFVFRRVLLGSKIHFWSFLASRLGQGSRISNMHLMQGIEPETIKALLLVGVQLGNPKQFPL